MSGATFCIQFPLFRLKPRSRRTGEDLLLVFNHILAVIELHLRLTYCLFLFVVLQDRSDFVVEFLKLRRPLRDLLRRERRVPYHVHVRRMLDRHFQHLAV